MKPIDLRNLTWESLQPLLRSLRGAVLATWRQNGPGTTAQLTALSGGISILTFRPRTTELVQMGLLRLTGHEEGEGVYEAVPEAEAQEAFEAARRAAAPGAEQTHLKL